MRHLLAALTFALSLGPAFAQDQITVEGAYAIVAMSNAPTSAVFMTIINNAAVDDRLLSAASDVAEKTELHTHAMTADGMMQMLEVEEGFPVPANASHALDRGGDHIMLIGLDHALAEGDRFALTLTFENAGMVVVVVPVGDAPPTSAHGEHGSHDAAKE